jgi:hypothetical protein
VAKVNWQSGLPSPMRSSSVRPSCSGHTTLSSRLSSSYSNGFHSFQCLATAERDCSQLMSKM